jgi:GT2 family glycosyltransferase
MLKISIVIVNWNTRAMLKQCLESVFQQTTASFEIFVVDNASGDGSGDMVLHDFPAVRLIQNPDNRGFAAANNQALRLVSWRTWIRRQTSARLPANY